MKLKNGCKKRTPWSTWLVLGLSCCLVLPGAAFGLRAQEKQNDTQENSPASKPSSVAIEQGSAWILNHQQREGSWWQKVDTDQSPDQDPKPPQEPKTGSSPAYDQQAETQPSAPGQVLPSAYYLRDDIQYFAKGHFKLERAAHALARADQKLPPGQDTSQPLQEKNTEQLHTYSWSISNVLERARQRSYSENMTPEAAVVTYFSRRFPATGNVSLFDDQLSITMTAKEAKAIGFLLDNWRKHGLDEIVTETRFFVVDPEKLETLKLDWEVSRPIVSQTEQQNDIPFLANLPYMSRVFSNVQVDAHGVEKIGVDLEVDKNGGFKATNRQATVQSAAFTTSSYLSLHTFLDDKQVRSLVGQVKQDASSNVLQAPTTRTLLGQPAQVVDAVKRPFVTEFRRADPNQPLSAKNYRPIVKLINEGRTIKQRVTENADGALSLNWGITIEAITDVDTIDMSIVSKGMALQQPRVSTRKIKSKLTLPKGKNTAAFCYFEKDQRGESKAFLVTSTVRKITFESQINTPTLNWTPNQAKPAQINPIKAGKLQAPSPPPPAFDYLLTAANGTAQKGSQDANQTIAGWLKNRGFLTQVSGDVEFKISDDRSLAEISGREFRFSSSDRDQFILAGGKGTLKIKSDNSETVSIEAVLTGKSEVRYEDMNLKADAIKFRIAAENDQEVFTFELSGNAQAFDDSGDSRFIADRIEWVYQPLKAGEKPQIIALLYGNANIQMKLSPDDRQPMNIKGDNLRFLLESSTFEAF